MTYPVHQRTKLYIASCLALTVTSLSFGIRAGILNDLGIEFGLNNNQLGTITSTAFWGFPIAIIIGGRLVEVVKVKVLLTLTFGFHLVGIIMTIFSSGYISLWMSTLMIGVANGLVEAICNPLIAQLYPEKKTTKLNHFHLWFPGGIMLGTLVVFLFNYLGWNWQIQLAMMLPPLIAYGYFFFYLPAPFQKIGKHELGLAHLKSLLNPLFLLMLVLMMGTAITELFTNQWIDVLLRAVTDNPILILMITAGVMVLGRGFAGPIVGKLSSLGVLTFSSIFSVLGIFLLANTEGNMLYFSAIIFGIGVCYFWPTMIGYVAETFPKTGPLGMAIVGAVGMFAVSIYTYFMGSYYDGLLLKYLPKGSNLLDFQNAEVGSVFAQQYEEAKKVASPDILLFTINIPIILTIVFGILFFFHYKKKNSLMKNG